MNWITRIRKASERITTAIKRRATKSEIAASKYISCHGVPTERKIIEQNNMVCPECNAHHFLNPSQRFTMMFGENNWKKIDSPLVKDPDPYNWVDTKKYKDRLKEAKKINPKKNCVIGFGITEKTISKLKSADGLVVGSAICKEITRSLKHRQNPVTNVVKLVNKLKRKII